MCMCTHPEDFVTLPFILPVLASLPYVPTLELSNLLNEKR